MMMMRETQNYCLCLNPFENRCRVNEKKAGLLTPCFLCLRAMGKGEGRGRAATPSRPDHPTRPDTQREVSGLQSDASGCKGGKAYASGCKRMQAKKQGGRGQGGGARGKGVAALAKGRKRKKPWRSQRGLMLLRFLMRQGSFAPLARLLPPAPLTPHPCPLPPCFCGCIPLAFRSHYGFSSPLHSARIRFSSPPSPFACRVGSGGRVGSGWRLSLSLPPCPSPEDLPPSPPSPPLPEGGSYKVCGCSPFGSQPRLNHLTSAVGLL